MSSRSCGAAAGPATSTSCSTSGCAWERALGAARWTCLSFPEQYGGRDATLLQQVIFYEEYARAGGPGRVGIIGEGLIGPTILHFGTDEQRARFLPKIASGEELWCQGYSEPERRIRSRQRADTRRAGAGARR